MLEQRKGGAKDAGRAGRRVSGVLAVLCVCLCVRLSPVQLRAESSLVGTGREGVGLVPDSDLQLSGSRLFPSNSAWIPHTEPKCQFTALSPAPFP